MHDLPMWSLASPRSRMSGGRGLQGHPCWECLKYSGCSSRVLVAIRVNCKIGSNLDKFMSTYVLKFMNTYVHTHCFVGCVGREGSCAASAVLTGVLVYVLSRPARWVPARDCVCCCASQRWYGNGCRWGMCRGCATASRCVHALWWRACGCPSRALFVLRALALGSADFLTGSFSGFRSCWCVDRGVCIRGDLLLRCRQRRWI